MTRRQEQNENKNKRNKNSKNRNKSKNTTKPLPQTPAILAQVTNIKYVFHIFPRVMSDPFSTMPAGRFRHFGIPRLEPAVSSLFPPHILTIVLAAPSVFASPFLYPCLLADLVISPLLLLLLLILPLRLVQLLSAHLVFSYFGVGLFFFFGFLLLLGTGCCLVAFCEVLAGFVVYVVRTEDLHLEY